MKLVKDFKKLVKEDYISLSKKGLNDVDLDVLCQVIEQSTVLEELYLGYNKVTLADGKLANAIAKNTTIKRLWLSNTNISTKGAKYLAIALKNNNTLEALDFNSNKIGDEGAECIADMLAENKTLQKITLGNNNIGDQGAERIATSLVENTSLHTIHLSYNKISGTGAEKLADALESNHSIKTLHLYGNNNISKDVMDRIEKILLDRNRKSTIEKPDDNKSKMVVTNKKNDTAKKDKGSISDQKMPASNDKRDTAVPSDGFVVKQGPGTSRELKVEDALLYLDKVKIEFGDQSHIYNGFLEIMKDFKAQKVGTIGVINRVRRLFHGHTDLILGFNMFLPDGYKIEIKEGYKPPPETKHRRESQPQEKRQRLSEPIVGGLKPQRLNFGPLSSSPGPNSSGNQSSTTDGFDQAVEYVKTVKKRFAPEIYTKFLQILHEYQKTECGSKEVIDEVSLLFEDHADLLKGFINYLPSHTQAQAKKQLEGAIKKAEEKKSSRSVKLAEQKDLTKDEEIAKLRVKLKALEEVITTKDEEIASLKDSLKKSKPIDVVDMTDNTSYKRARTENTPKALLFNMNKTRGLFK